MPLQNINLVLIRALWGKVKYPHFIDQDIEQKEG